MKKKLSFFAIILATFLFTACSSGSKIGGTNKNCGCGAKRGMVGY